MPYNSNFNLRRNELIEMSYKKLGVLQQSRHGMTPRSSRPVSRH
jgi:hypothetical protein